MTVTTLSEARALRPSQVIAEALVDRQAPNQIAARARELGYSRSLTHAVVHACCGKHEHQRPSGTHHPIPNSTADHHPAS